MSAPPLAGGVAGYCGRCGTAFGLNHGQFCGRCGNSIAAAPAAAVNCTYPVVPSSSVPAAQHRLGHMRLIIVAGVALAVLVGAGTAAAVSLKPTISYCHFSCGPDIGPRLFSSTAYQSSQYGYRVEYNSKVFSPSNQTSSGIQLAGNQDNFTVFAAVAGSDVTGAINNVVNSLSSAEFEDMRAVSTAIPGAEIGYVPGSGEVLWGDFVPPGGGSSQPVSVAVIAAAQGDLTITVLVVGSQDLSSAADVPYGFTYGQLLDFAISNTVWPAPA